MVRAGAMRFVIEVQQRSTEQDAYGQPLRTWTTLRSCRAAMQRLSGDEVANAAHRSANVATVFRTRYWPDITNAMRIVHDGRVYDIKSAIDVDGLKAELLITAEEQVGEES